MTVQDLNSYSLLRLVAESVDTRPLSRDPDAVKTSAFQFLQKCAAHQRPLVSLILAKRLRDLVNIGEPPAGSPVSHFVRSAVTQKYPLLGSIMMAFQLSIKPLPHRTIVHRQR